MTTPWDERAVTDFNNLPDGRLLAVTVNLKDMTVKAEVSDGMSEWSMLCEVVIPRAIKPKRRVLKRKKGTQSPS